MFGASARDISTLPRDLLPRTLSQTGLGAAASLKAPSTVRRRNIRVCAQCAASCEVLRDNFHHCHLVYQTVVRWEGMMQSMTTDTETLSRGSHGAGAGRSTPFLAELCPGTEALLWAQ